MNIPQLRFPKFVGEWEKKKLGEVAEKINSGKTPLGGESVYTESGILFIRSQNVTDDKLSFENSTYISEEINSTMKNSVVKANDILLNITGASLGRSCVVPNNFTIGNVNQHVCIIRLKKDCNPRFVQPILSSTKGQKIFVSIQTGSGREGLNFESIKGIEIALPTLPEQTKIASFLTAVDEKIQALKKKHHLLEQYKKGVMQMLFCLHHDSLDLHDDPDSQGEQQEKNQGNHENQKKSRFRQLRFKDENGNDFPEWEVKKLGEVLSIPEKTKPEKIEKDKLLTVKLHLRGLFKNESTEGLSIGSTTYYVRTKGQFIYGKQNLFNGAFGIIPNEFDGYLSSGDVPALDVNQSIINPKFLYYYFAREVFYKKLEEIASGSGSKRIHEETLLKVEISIPCLQEQTAIANFLSALDEKINLQTQMIASLEQWKKGLLQKMFV